MKRKYFFKKFAGTFSILTVTTTIIFKVLPYTLSFFNKSKSKINKENENTFGPRSFRSFVSEPTLFDEWLYGRNKIEEIKKRKEEISEKLKRYKKQLKEIKNSKDNEDKKINVKEATRNLKAKLRKAKGKHNKLEQKITNINQKMNRWKSIIKYQQVHFKKTSPKLKNQLNDRKMLSIKGDENIY